MVPARFFGAPVRLGAGAAFFASAAGFVCKGSGAGNAGGITGSSTLVGGPRVFCESSGMAAGALAPGNGDGLAGSLGGS